MKSIIYIVVIVMVIDLLGFVSWALSGQVAPDKYHTGIISESIIKIIK